MEVETVKMLKNTLEKLEKKLSEELEKRGVRNTSNQAWQGA